MRPRRLVLRWSALLSLPAALLWAAGGGEERPAFHNPPAPLTMAEEVMGGQQGPFFPSSLRTADGKPAAASTLLESETCGRSGCHPDIAREWKSSMHALSDLENPWYRKSFEAMQKEVGVTPAKWCAGCHSPALLATGGMERPAAEIAGSPAGHAGVTCASCHLVSAVGSTMGQAHFELAVPPAALSPEEIRRHPEEHRQAYARPLLRGPLSAAFCSTCHKSHLDTPVNGFRWVREVNDYDHWQASSISGYGARSYYLPKTPQTCADCHMPRVRSRDAGNRDGWIHSHRFPGANTALPALRGDREQLKTVEDFLRGAVKVDLFAMTEAGTPSSEHPAGEVLAPLDRIPATVRRGESRRFDVMVSNQRAGHLFPGGKQDMHDCWVELKAVDDRGRVLFWSGKADEGSAVDPGAHAYHWIAVDAEGKPIDRRNMWAAREQLYTRWVMPNTSEVVRYRFDIPADAGDTITLTARVNYRKIAWSFTQWAFAGAAKIPRPPIVAVSESRVKLRVLPAGAALPDMRSPRLDPAVDRRRFYDYAIGLYLQHDFPGAEGAARKVTELDPGSADGWANLGQSALTRNDLKAAREALEKAVRIAPESTRVRFLLGQLEKAAGNSAQAIEHLRKVATLYPEDRVAWAELASVLAQQKDFKGAAEALEKILTIDPEDRGAHYNLALAYKELGETDKAALHQKLFERFVPLGQATVVDAKYWAAHPLESNERQIFHEHVSVPLPPIASPPRTGVKAGRPESRPAPAATPAPGSRPRPAESRASGSR